jgi:hypothetical protein
MLGTKEKFEKTIKRRKNQGNVVMVVVALLFNVGC